MKPAAGMLGIGILVLAAVVIGHALQVAPSPGATEVASYEPAPLQDAPLITTRETPHWTPTRIADPAGFSFALRTTGSPGARYVTYEGRCSPSGYAFLWRSTFEVQLTASFKWFTDPAGGDNPDIEGNCVLVVIPAGFADVVVGAAPGPCPYGGFCAAFVAWGEGTAPPTNPQGPVTQGPSGPSVGPSSTAPSPIAVPAWLWILAGALLIVGIVLVLIAVFGPGG